MEMLKLDVIRTDGGTQARAGLVPDVVAEYAEAVLEGARMPPLVVYHDGGSYWLADGFHRLAAYRKVGVLEAPVEVRSGSRRDAILYAVGANAAHGLRRSNADKRRAVEILLRDEEWSRWSDREIARRCAVSHEFVRRLRASICQPLTDAGEAVPGADGVSERRLVRRGESVYEQDTSRIGAGRRVAAGNTAPSGMDAASGVADASVPVAEEPVPPPAAGRVDSVPGRGPGDSEVERLRKRLMELDAEVRALKAENEALRNAIEAEGDGRAKELVERLERLMRHNRVLEARVQSLLEEKAEAIRTARYWERRARKLERAGSGSGGRVAAV